MNIFRRELRAYRKSLLIWSVCMVFLVLAGMGKYSAADATAGADFNTLIAEMPKFLQGIFGWGVLDLSLAADYYAVMFLYVALVAAIHAAMLGAGILSKEERDCTAEFLLTKPVSRTRILTAKCLAALMQTVLLNLVTWAASYGTLQYYAKDEAFASELFRMMAALFAIQVFFAAMGLFAAAAARRPKRAAGTVSAVLLVMFLFSVAADMTDKAEVLRYLSVFKYYDTKELLKGGYLVIYAVLPLALAALFIAGAYTLYPKRDMSL